MSIARETARNTNAEDMRPDLASEAAEAHQATRGCYSRGHGGASAVCACNGEEEGQCGADCRRVGDGGRRTQAPHREREKEEKE